MFTSARRRVFPLGGFVKKRLLSLAAAGALAGLGLGGLASAPAQACPGNYHPDPQQNTTTYIYGDETGGIYDSGGDPTTNDGGYIGVAGDSAAGSGYIEAGGSKSDPTNGYIVASQKGGSGVEISSGSPGPC